MTRFSEVDVIRYKLYEEFRKNLNVKKMLEQSRKLKDRKTGKKNKRTYKKQFKG